MPIDIPKDGKPVVIYFFSTTCPVCTTVKPHISKAEEQYKDRIHVIRIDVRNTHSSAQKLIKHFDVRSVPETYILKDDGLKRIAYFRGVFDWPKLRNAINNALAGSNR